MLAVLGFCLFSFTYGQSSFLLSQVAEMHDNSESFYRIPKIIMAFMVFSIVGLLILIAILVQRFRHRDLTYRTVRNDIRHQDLAMIGGQVGIWEVDIPNRGHRRSRF